MNKEMRETSEGQTHFCDACNFDANDLWHNVPHTCGRQLTAQIGKEADNLRMLLLSKIRDDKKKGYEANTILGSIEAYLAVGYLMDRPK